MNEKFLPDLFFPAFFLLETVRGCNARCPFCPVGTGQIDDFGLMSDDIYERIEQEIIHHSAEVKRVTLNTFGEPLLDSKLEDRVKSLKKGGIVETALATNAMLLSGRRAEALFLAGLDILRISISTLNPAKYPLLRKGLDLERVMSNAENAFLLRDRLSANTRIYLSMEKSPLIDTEDIRQWKEHWSRFVRNGDMLKIDVCFDLTIENRKNLGGGTSGPCIPMMQTMDIAWSGDVVLCCADFKGSASPYRLGRVQEQSIAEIWSSGVARHFRELHRQGRRHEIELCRGCDIWDAADKENIVIESDVL